MGKLDWLLFASEIGALICGLFFVKKLKQTIWITFPFYFLFIVICETIGNWSRVNNHFQLNQILYQFLVIPTEFVFFFWIFYKSFKKNWQKKMSILFVIIYLLVTVINSLFLGNKTFVFYSISYTTGNLLLLVQIIIYFLQLMNSSDLLKFKTNILFWVSLGLLIFYLGTFPYFGLINILYKDYTDIYLIYRDVVMVLDAVMYLMFAISFIWGKPTNT